MKTIKKKIEENNVEPLKAEPEEFKRYYWLYKVFNGFAELVDFLNRMETENTTVASIDFEYLTNRGEIVLLIKIENLIKNGDKNE